MGESKAEGFAMKDMHDVEEGEEPRRTRVKRRSSLEVVQGTQFYKTYVRPNLNKGTLSNMVTFVIMIIGLGMVVELDNDSTGDKVGRWILSFGLFGFAGGVTNWLAIKMLFDQVPGLVGSGVIPRRFKEIRQVVKDTIMKTFFDEEYLAKYMSQKVTEFTANLDLDNKIKNMLDSPEVDEIIEKNLNELSQRPEGMWMAMMGLTPESLKPMIKPFVLGMGTHVGPLVVDMMSSNEVLKIDKIRDEIDRLMTQKLQELTPPIVKKLMEEVIREHLGWLIVWGNVFGGLIGIISMAAGY